MSWSPTYEFRVGRDASGVPCLEMYHRDGILPVGRITRGQLAEVLAAPTARPEKRRTEEGQP